MRPGRFPALACLALLALLAALPAPRSAAGPAVPPVDGSQPIVLMWQVHPTASEEELAYLARAGVTLVQSFRTRLFPEAEVTAHLDRLARAGLGAAPYVGNHEGTGTGCRFPGDSLDFVRRHRGHPAIAAWHLLDEPALKGISPDCQRALYRAVKALDPDTPVLISANNNTAAKYRDFFAEDAFDLLDLHYYVNPHPAHGQARLIRLIRRFQTRPYPVIMTLRAFNSPHKPGRRPMPPGSLREQYDFFITAPGFTPHVGFYGWDLNPNEGIRKLPALKAEFDALMADRRAGRL